MSAGQPDWGKLAAMGKLPEHGKKFVPYLAEATEASEANEALAEENKALKTENSRLKALLTKNGIDWKPKEKPVEPVKMPDPAVPPLKIDMTKTTGAESTPAVT